MKRIGIIAILFGLGVVYVYPQDSIVSIPDTAFLFALIEVGVDTNGDGLISYSEAETVTSLDVSGGIWNIKGNISDMSGIEAFINMNNLQCRNNQITSLDISNNADLTNLNCSRNQITSLDISNNADLTDLDCNWNQLTSLDLSNNLELLYLDVGDNQLTSLDVSSNTKLWSLICGSNHLTSLDVSKNTNLCGMDWHCFGCQKSSLAYYWDRIGLDCSNNLLISLNVSSNTKLEALDCSFNQLTSLDVSGCDSLAYLLCHGNQLTDLDISDIEGLEFLDCSGMQFTDLDISNNKDLESLDCSGMQLTDLDVTNNTELAVLLCNDNQLSSLDVTNNPKLSFDFAVPGLDCSNNLLTRLDVSNNIELRELVCSGNQLTSLDISNNIYLFNLELSDMPSLGQVCVWESFPVFFVDENLREYDVDIDTTNSPNVYFTTECASGIKKRDYNNIAIYPNPTNTILTIETGISDHYSIEITSLNGQILCSVRMEGTTHQLDLSYFQSGVYCITIRSKDFVTTRKIIKL